jgi:hypothetical protein
VLMAVNMKVMVCTVVPHSLAVPLLIVCLSLCHLKSVCILSTVIPTAPSNVVQLWAVYMRVCSCNHTYACAHRAESITSVFDILMPSITALSSLKLQHHR